MAEGEKSKVSTLQEAAQTPGIGMRLTISLMKQKFPTVKNMSTGTLGDKLDSLNSGNCSNENVLLLDCRPVEEYSISKIPGSVRVDHNLNAEEILQDLTQNDENLQQKDNVVCYCSVGYRSSVVAEKLQEFYKKEANKGNENLPTIYNLEGSLFKWANESRKMVDAENKPTPYAHPYNSIFGKLLDSKLRKEK